MHLKHIVSLVLASLAGARNLSEALASQNSSLSALNGLLSPSVLDDFNKVSNITVLAPNNGAIRRFLDESPGGSISRYGPDVLAAIIRYHILNGTYYTSNLTQANASVFIPTFLTNSSYANITGGQRVEATTKDGHITLTSGLEHNSSVVKSDTNFTGGTVHIVDRVLTLPVNDTRALKASNLTATAGAFGASNQSEKIEAEKDLTIFAPSNHAFGAVGNLVKNMTDQQLEKLVQYHVVPRNVMYSPQFKNGTFKTSNGESITIAKINETVFVNSARVVHENILVNNGVVHVLDNVLNPNNTTATPNVSATSGLPAFNGGSSTSAIPFTSATHAETTTTATSTGLAAPAHTGAVGVAALFGGVAVMANW